MSEKIPCPHGCGEFESIGNHWSKGDVCEEPQLSEKQKDIVTGILMGDGCIDYSDKNPRLVIEIINKEYIDHIDSVLGIFSTGVSLCRSAEEGARMNRERDFRPEAKEADYSDLFRLTTRNLEQLEDFSQWYSSGSKVFPENIDLTPTVLKHWYVCDGSYSLKEESRRGNIVISVNNERKYKKKLESYFRENIGVGVDYWREYETDAGRKDCSMVFHADTTEQLFEYMGSPLPGFEYKWPN